MSKNNFELRNLSEFVEPSRGVQHKYTVEKLQTVLNWNTLTGFSHIVQTIRTQQSIPFETFAHFTVVAALLVGCLSPGF